MLGACAEDSFDPVESKKKAHASPSGDPSPRADRTPCHSALHAVGTASAATSMVGVGAGGPWL
jgi:hypothetical protein